jgi:hypothetical protein
MTAVARALLWCADELIQNDRWLTTAKFVIGPSVSKGSMNNIIDALGYSKVCACWVPRSLTDYNKTVRKEVCSDLLSRYQADGESSLSHIVSRDETLIHYFEPQAKR